MAYMKKKMRSKKGNTNMRKTKRIRGGSLYPTQNSTYDPLKINNAGLQGKVSSAIAAARKNREEEVGIKEFFSRPFYTPNTYINGKYVLTQDELDFNEAKEFYLKRRS
jgi:hypothetical protein